MTHTTTTRTPYILLDHIPTKYKQSFINWLERKRLIKDADYPNGKHLIATLSDYNSWKWLFDRGLIKDEPININHLIQSIMETTINTKPFVKSAMVEFEVQDNTMHDEEGVAFYEDPDLYVVLATLPEDQREPFSHHIIYNKLVSQQIEGFKIGETADYEHYASWYQTWNPAGYPVH